MVRLINYFVLIMFLALFNSCSKDSNSPTETGNGNNYNPNGHWSLPIFLSNSFNNKYNPSITGDGKTLYCDSYEPVVGQQIYVSTNDGNGWSQLTQLPFTNYQSPCITYDGTILYFYKFDNNIYNGVIYKSVKSGNNWSQPDSVMIGMDPSITQDGKTMFYVKYSGTFPNNTRGVYYANLENNIWVEKGVISEVNTLNGFDPGISGDGTLLFFTRSEGNGYKIYYTLKVNNVWQSPQVLSNDINFTDENYTACVSWDKMKLFYSTYTQGGSGSTAGIYMATWVNE